MQGNREESGKLYFVKIHKTKSLTNAEKKKKSGLWWLWVSDASLGILSSKYPTRLTGKSIIG